MNTFETLSNSIINTLASNLSCCGDYSFEVIESEYSKDFIVSIKNGLGGFRLQFNHILPLSIDINQTPRIFIRIEDEDGWISVDSEYILPDNLDLVKRLTDSLDRYFVQEIVTTRNKLQLLERLYENEGNVE